MSVFSRSRWLTYAALILSLVLSFALTASVFVFAAGSSPLQLSSDPYTNTTSQHQTEVEPDSYSNGSTIITAIQVGRFTDGGASNIGWATSTDNGTTWKNGFLPGTTVYATPAGQYERVSDPSVTYDASHHAWMISSLAISSVAGSPVGVAVLVSLSTDGGLTWQAPVVAASTSAGFFDKEWIVCDNTSTSPFYGHCEALPSAEIDGSGKVYVAWQDCRFESGCSANDIVMSTSTDGTTWSAAQRIPADAAGSGVDHFIPGLAVDTSTSGNTAHLGLAFYYYPNANCTTSTCQLQVGFVSSTDGGTSWSAESTLTPSAMNVAWLASTTQGNMVGDYISTSFSNGKAYPVFVVATAPNGGQLNEAMFTATSGLAITGGTSTASGDSVVFTRATSGAPTVLRTAY